ncbi:MAG: DMT family transporter [Acidipropionibacterium sp.]|nr:DMT family transporter [Acidipropionibacterium sp.]
MSDRRVLGLSLAVVSPLLWGSSGVVAQHLFKPGGISTGWLVAHRLLASGILLLGFAMASRHDIRAVFRTPKDVARLLIFSVFGMLGVQLSYFMAIRTGNAAVATILQYLSPVMVILFLAIRHLRAPRRVDLVSVVVAVSGTLLIVTQGRFGTLAVPPQAVFWGLITAVCAAAYTLLPGGLLRRYGAVVVVGWAMLIGGVLAEAYYRPWREQVHLDALGVAEVVFVIVFGTMLAFLFYLQSLRYITPTTASVLGAIEPLSATALAVAFLGVSFNLYGAVGMLLVIAVTFIQVWSARRPPTPSRPGAQS